MIADPVQDASAVAKGMVADEGKLELYGSAKFEPGSGLEPDAASAYVRAQPWVIRCHLIHFEDAHRDSDGVAYLSPSVGRSRLNGRGRDNSKVILHNYPYRHESERLQPHRRRGDCRRFLNQIDCPYSSLAGRLRAKSGVCNVVFEW